LKEKLQEENKKTSNGPRFRSAKKGKYSKYDVCLKLESSAFAFDFNPSEA
jgi:hypothetical protein